jgi:Sporulation delaying protein SdpA
MSNKKKRHAKLFFSTVKIGITIATVLVYFHYFRHQSWGYFTIDPRQPLINIYAVNGDTLSKEPVIKNNASYGMGISRKGIIWYNELANVVANNKNLPWKKLDKDSVSHIVTTGGDVGLTGYNDLGVGKGRFLLTKTERAPFESAEKKKFIPVEYYTLTDIR